MPTLTELLSKWVPADYYFRAHCVGVPVIHGNKLLYVLFEAHGFVHIVDFTTPDIKTIQVASLSALSTSTRLLKWFYDGKKLYMTIARIDTGYLYVGDVEVDLDTLTGSYSEKSFSFDFIDAWEEIAHACTIPPRLVCMPDRDSDDGYVIDVETGNYRTVTIGERIVVTEYFGRFSHKYIAKENDIIMFVGPHYSGHEHQLYSFYADSKTDLYSSGDGSPRPQIFGHYVALYGKDSKTFAPVTSGGVADADNDVHIYDFEGNQLSTFDLATETGFTYCNYHGGGHVLGKLSNGNYIFFLMVHNNSITRDTDRRLYMVELSGTDFSKVSATELAKWTNTDLGFTAINVFSQMFPEYSDWSNRPIVDITNHKMYFFIQFMNSDTNDVLVKLFELDFSDLDIVEYNANAWIIV